VAPVADVRRFFWWRPTQDLIDSTVADGRLVRVGSTVLSVPS